MTYAKGRGLEGVEGLKLAQTMCLALFGPLVSFFFSLFVLLDKNGFFIVCIGYIYDICEK